MSNTKSIRERFNTIFNKGPEKWLSRSLFEEDDHLSRGRADVEAHRAQGFGRQGKPMPAPAIQQRMGSQVKPQEPEVKLDLSRGESPLERGAFQKPEDRKYERGEQEEKFNRLQGGRNNLVRSDFARLNSKLDWGDLDTNDENVLQDVRDYGANAIFYAQNLRDDIKNDDYDESLGDSLTYEQVHALMANKDRNLALFGQNIEDGEFEGRPDPEQTKMLQESMRPFKFSDDFVETTYNLLRQIFKVKEAWGGTSVGGVNKNAPESGMKGLLDIINNDLQGEDDTPVTSTELNKIFKKMLDDGDYSRPEREFYKGKRSDEEKPGSARIQRVYDLMEVATKHGALGDEMRREEDGSETDHQARRSRIMWKLFLEQGGREAMTGLPLDPLTMQLEHIAPAERGELRNPTDSVMSRFKEVDNDQNFALLNKAVNQNKNNLDMQGFYDNIVGPLAEITPEQFQHVGNLTGEAKGEVDNFLSDIMSTMFADGNFANEGSSTELLSQINGLKERIGTISDRVFENLEDEPIKLSQPKAINSNARDYKQTTPKGRLATALKHREQGKTLKPEQEELIREWEEVTTPENDRKAQLLLRKQQEFARQQEEFDNFDEDDYNKKKNDYDVRKDFYQTQGKDKINRVTGRIAKKLLGDGFGVKYAGHNEGQGSLQYGPARLQRVLDKFINDGDNLDSNKQLWEQGITNSNRLAKLRDQLIRGDLEGEDLDFFENAISEAGLNREEGGAGLAKKYIDYFLDNNGF